MKVFFILSFCVTALVFKLDYISCANMTMPQKLEKLRMIMKDQDCDAFIIPSEDQHQSEYPADYDKRRAWISGFTGSAGTAVVTIDKALLWTDGRYYLQASNQLNKTYWSLMKQTDASIESFLGSLESIKNVCQDPQFISTARWKSREINLKILGLNFVPTQDLIDKFWPADERAKVPNSEVYIHELKYAGLSFQDKIKLVQAKIMEANADFYVVTALDEIAWLFNLRGSDIDYNPVFYAYAIIFRVKNSHSLFINSTRPNFQNTTGNYLKDITIKNYEEIKEDLTLFSENNETIWMSPLSSYALYEAVSNKDLIINSKESPIKLIKAVKTDIEIKNIRECQLRDSAARIRHMYWLDTEMEKMEFRITEKSAAQKLKEIQSEDNLFWSSSFESISAVGKNAAVIHYATSEGDDSVLVKEKIYLLDAGAQYMDCTTDITRTHHFGTPSKKEIFAYTRVMQGTIDLSNIYFPEGVYGYALDVQARASLWKGGLDYGHGTGHGIGYFLSVHEAPPYILYSSTDRDLSLTVGMVLSDEPGYYEEGFFGIRLENDIEVVRAKAEYSSEILKFNSLSLVPFERKLIDECILTEAHVSWLNSYNTDIKNKIKPKLAGYPDVQRYLDTKTENFIESYKNPKCKNYFNSGSKITLSSPLMAFCVAVIFKIYMTISI